MEDGERKRFCVASIPSASESILKPMSLRRITLMFSNLDSRNFLITYVAYVKTYFFRHHYFKKNHFYSMTKNTYFSLGNSNSGS